MEAVFDPNIIQWIQDQYHVIGRKSDGTFIGKREFKIKLISRYATVVAKNGDQSGGGYKVKIRQIVNANLYLPTSDRDANGATQPASMPQTADQDRTVTSMGSTEAANSPRAVNDLGLGNGVPLAQPTANGEQPHDHGHGASEVPQIFNTVDILSPAARPRLNVKMQELKNDIERVSLNNVNGHRENDRNLDMPTLESQLRLLGSYGDVEGSQANGLPDVSFRDALLFPAEALRKHGSGLSPQYGLLGSVLPGMEISSATVVDPRLFLNTNIPFSTFICGLQGSGKSHTMSCILENCLIEAPILGLLQKPLSALVFHFSQYISRLTFRPCEAAFLGYPHPKFLESPGVRSLNILVAPSNFQNLNASYRQIPGVKVRPFKLRSRDLNISFMLTLMAVDQTGAAPLYMIQITRVLRQLAATSAGEFDYKAFKAALKTCSFSQAQSGPLQQRLEILESFLDLDDESPGYDFEAGSITIIDLSCPFVDANTACVLFNICMGMYLESGSTHGKIIAVDEAHKYMTDTPASKALTDSLLTVIRQQRHYGARVIVSTQEPTISPRLIDLCSMFIIHRFSSPEWFDVVRKHISVTESNNASLESLFGCIINLRVGEALLFAPSAIVSRCKEEDMLCQLGSRLLKVKMRNRLTWDGGKTVVCL